MTPERTLTAARLREVLDYDPLTGIFTWKVRLSRAVATGAVAGGAEGRGYRKISIDEKSYSAASLAWLHFYGIWPGKYLYYQNKDTMDCRIENLSTKSPPISAEVLAQGRLRRRHQEREYRKANVERYRSSDLKKRFGIGTDEHQRRLAEQGGVCAICGKPETVKRNGKNRWMAVDHCHKTNKIRGLLCGRCNPMIGYSQDDPAILDKAAAYLRRHTD